MSKVTLIWMSTNQTSFKSYTLPKAVLFLFVAGFFLFLSLSVAMFAFSRSYYLRASGCTEKNMDLNRIITERETEVEQLASENSFMMGKIQDFQAVEKRIRVFLGLSSDSADPNASPHQGGVVSDPLGAEDTAHQGGTYDDDPSIPGDLSDVKFPADGQLASIGMLQQNLREIHDYLAERRQESRRIPMILPVDGDDIWISGKFGWRKDPFTGTGKHFHRGLDIAGPRKTPILATADGKVVKAGKDKYLGNYVSILHNDEYTTLYGHMHSIGVKRGQTVKRSQVIGTMGNTGRSTGTHLHYGVMKNKQYVNPLDFIWDFPENTLALQ